MDERLLDERADDLYENAPCGYLSTDLGGRIVKVNDTFLRWTGYTREHVVGARRFQDLLTVGGRIYHETHVAPLLRMQGEVREIAVEIKRADGTLLAALLNSMLRADSHGAPRVVRTTVLDATDRRRYEQELLAARRREHEIVDELQRNLLSGAVPAASDFEIGIAYRAAGEGLQVGGDWYDAFWLDEHGRDVLALVVGDVVGRGITAAATMGQLRSAIRALAATGLSPGAVLDGLDRFARRHEIGTGTTVVYVQVELEAARLRWAAAGHLPPLLARRDEAPDFLWDGRSPPLGVWDGDLPARQEGDAAIAAGDALLLYTDGLVERRSIVLDRGLERLRSDVERRSEATAAELASSVFRALDDAEHADDVCLLAFRKIA